MSSDDDKRANGSEQADLILRRSEKRLRDFHADAIRRDAEVPGIFSRIESVLASIQATPLLQHDLHCQNLMVRIAQAGTMEDFAMRVAGFEQHIRRIRGVVTAHETAGGVDDVAPSKTILNRGVGELRIEPDADGDPMHPDIQRMHLKL